MHFTLVKMNPEDAPPSHGFDDAILPLYFALKRLGYAVEILCNRANPESRNIVFGSCIAPRRTGRLIPPGSIVFNLEQIVAGSKWCNRDYMAHLRDFPVWDYSAANVAALFQAGITNVTHVPLGYVPEMTRLRETAAPSVEALFYGLITDRRHLIIRRLLEHGVKVLATQDAFGNLRDKLLASARLVLNLHSFIPAKLEVIRLGYVFANKKPVVSEAGPDTEIPPHLADACLFASAEDLPEATQKLLADPARLRQQAETGYAAFAARPMERELEKIVGRRKNSLPPGPPTGHAAPSPELSRTREWLILEETPIHDRQCPGLNRKQALRFRKGIWENLEDVVSDEQRLIIVWQDDLTGDSGRETLWSWPHELAPLALGHVLLDIRPQESTLARQCSVTQPAGNECLVTLGALREQQRRQSLKSVSGGALFRAMRAFITAQSQWDSTGCFHQAGIFDPDAGQFLARAEDIGRHNCLDRLAGWSAMHSIPLTNTILFTSARITASFCAKALRAGFPILVSRSAVTTASIALAEEHQASLIGFARTDEERLTLFADPQGLVSIDSI